MTALAKDRSTQEFGAEVLPTVMAFPVAAATTIYGGSLVAMNASGYAVPASADTSLKVFGVARKQAVNTVAAGYGSAGDLTVEAVCGSWWLANGDSITAADIGKLCYAMDDQTVSKGTGAGLRPPVGKIVGYSSTLGVAVSVGQPSLWDADDVIEPPDQVKIVRARNVVNGNIADLTAYTVASNAAVNDATLNVAGDVVLLVAQSTAAQNGLYVVGTVATGVAPLTRHPSMPTGAAFLADQYEINVSVGTVFGHTKWFNAAAGTIGTNTPSFFPESVTISQVLTAGTAAAIQSIPLLSATKSNIIYTRTATGGTLTNTVGYQTVPAPTPGAIGTASIVPMAVVAAGTVQNLDTSTLLLTVVNR